MPLEKQALLTGPLMWLGTVTAPPLVGGDLEKWGWLVCTIIGALANAYVLILRERDKRARSAERTGNEAD